MIAAHPLPIPGTATYYEVQKWVTVPSSARTRTACDVRGRMVNNEDLPLNTPHPPRNPSNPGWLEFNSAFGPNQAFVALWAPAPSLVSCPEWCPRNSRILNFPEFRTGESIFMVDRDPIWKISVWVLLILGRAMGRPAWAAMMPVSLEV